MAVRLKRLKKSNLKVVFFIVGALLALSCSDKNSSDELSTEEFSENMEADFTGFRKCIEKANRLRVRSGGSCHRTKEMEKTLIAVTDKQLLEEIASNINFRSQQCAPGCACCGDPTFEWYKGKRLLAMVSLHHGIAMRWPKHWPGDAILTGDSSEWLVQWLAKNGVAEPKQQVDAQKHRRDMARKGRDKLKMYVPEELSIAIKKIHDPALMISKVSEKSETESNSDGEKN